MTTWTYDNAYRLAGQQAASANATFVYDAAGNILTKAQDGSSPMTMTYDAGNRLQAVTQGANLTTVAYDANGNLSTETLGAAVTTYQYDPENHLTGIVNPDATRSTYTYSATGLRRTAQEPGATQTLFVWDGDDYLQERAASTVLYVVQDAEILAEKRSGSRNWYVPDPLGSTSLLLDASLNVTDRFEYWPYGEERNHVGASVTPFRYVGTLGYYRDAAGRIYVRARELRPDYGRWLTEDPIGFDGGDWNLYACSANRPVDVTDPSGLGPPVPDCTNATGLPKVPCPPAIAQAKQTLCQKLLATGEAGVVATGCLTGPRQARCMLDWCRNNNNQGTYVYCIAAPSPWCTGNCAFSCTSNATQNPDWAVYLCYPRPAGCVFPACRSSLVDSILHEMAGVCGSGHNGGSPNTDPCENRANCLCQALGL